MPASRLILPVFIVACPASLVACATGTTLGGVAGDAATWGDVVLPDVTVPDGYLITSATPDGHAMTSSPASVCQAIGAVDGGADGTTDAATNLMDARVAEAASADAPTDAPADANLCPTALGLGDLVFDEVMIATEPGSDDRGQWLEVRSTRACTVDLLGLHASALHGESFRTLDVTTDTWLPPGGYFLIADTTDATENNMLPGLVMAWAGSPADALHKTSDVITLSLGMVTIDTLSYPDKTRPEATSLAFPSNCSPALRADFANWMPSTASWLPGLYGTPNAPNTDVMCAAAPPAACAGLRAPPR